MKIWLNQDEIKEIKRLRAEGTHTETSTKRPYSGEVMQYKDYIKQAVEGGQFSKQEGEDSLRLHKGVTSFVD